MNAQARSSRRTSTPSSPPTTRTTSSGTRTCFVCRERPEMKDAAKNLEFEKAALLRDCVVELRRELVGDEEGLEAIAPLRRGGGRPVARVRAGRGGSPRRGA